MEYRGYDLNKEARIAPVIPLSVHIDGEFLQPQTPFGEVSWWRRILRRSLVSLLRIIELVFSSQFLVEDKYLEMRVFSKPTRRLLARMIASGLVTKWDCKKRHRHSPYYFCTLWLGDRRDSNGVVLTHTGGQAAHGSGETPDQALIVALAEALERAAISEWNGTKLLRADNKELSQKGVSHFAHNYFVDQSDKWSTGLSWVQALDLWSRRTILVPASMIFLRYAQKHPEGVVFLQTTSNGVGAHTNESRAVLGGLYESLERDGFLMYWLNKIAPTRIDISTITDKESLLSITLFQKMGIKQHLLDCRTEFGIPILALVLLDPKTGGVNLQLAAGCNIPGLIRKLYADALRWNLDWTPERPNKEPAAIKTMQERARFWHGGYMQESIDWFLSGPLTSYREYTDSFSLPIGVEQELLYIKQQLKKGDREAYYYIYNSDLARKAGLIVARVIVPDLIPIYFDEARKHLNVPRVYSFKKTMGIEDVESSVEEINQIPHPFI